MAPFLVNALAAGVGIAIVSAPLGCFVVWRRMAYMGEAIAQAGLIGVALGLMLQLDQTMTTLAVVTGVALGLAALSRRSSVPFDSLLGLIAHGALAAGVIAAMLIRGGSIDLMSYLFGDIFAVTRADLAWVGAGGLLVLTLLARFWQPLLAVSIHPELAEAEGISRQRTERVLIVLLALTIAVSIKIVGVLLAVAFLIMPAVAARSFASTPEGMAILAAAIAVAGVLTGLVLSFHYDVPGGPAIVLVLAVAAVTSVLARPRGRES